jgi:hypothetical protein
MGISLSKKRLSPAYSVTICTPNRDGLGPIYLPNYSTMHLLGPRSLPVMTTLLKLGILQQSFIDTKHQAMILPSLSMQA